MVFSLAAKLSCSDVTVAKSGGVSVSESRFGSATFLAIVIAQLAGGVLLFGAVYPWAYWPLLAAVACTGVWMLVASKGRPSTTELVVAGLVVAPILVQSVPLSGSWLTELAPQNAAFLRAFELNATAAGGDPPWLHPLSVNPAMTRLVGPFLIVGVVWIGGIALALRSFLTPRQLAHWTVMLAICVAVLGLAQRATFNGKIYWFWESRFRQSFNYFGPFINRNHFAGWMLLALGLGAGVLIGQLSTAGKGVKPGFREHLLWLGTAQASAILLTGIGLVVMAVSLVWTMSRSGIAAAIGAVLLLLAAICARRKTTFARRGFTGAVVMLALGGAIAWKGVDRLSAWYGNTGTFEWRLTLWRDTLAPLKDFWLTGSGLNTYGTVMLLYPQTDTTVHAQQAHNDYLQLAVEGGLLVCIPVLIAIILLARLMWRRLQQPQDEMTWWIRMGAIAGICGMAIQEVSDFSLQIPGVALLFATCIAIAIHEPALLQSRRLKRGVPRSVTVQEAP